MTHQQNQDSFEQLEDLEQNSPSATPQATPDPTQMSDFVNQLYGVEAPADSPTTATPGDKGIEALEQGQGGKTNHTPLDEKQLKEKQTQQDDAKKLAAARKRFHEWKGELDAHYEKSKQEAEQKKKKEEQEAEAKKQQEAKQKKEAEAGDNDAHGKSKAVLGQPRRKATTEQHPETKAGGAK